MLLAAAPVGVAAASPSRSEEHTSELQSQSNLVCRLLLEKKELMLASLLQVGSVQATCQQVACTDPTCKRDACVLASLPALAARPPHPRPTLCSTVGKSML